MQFTVGSPQQLSRSLFGKLGLPESGGAKTRFLDRRRGPRGDSRRASDHRRGPRCRDAHQAEGTYFDALGRTDLPGPSRLHTTFNRPVAATGRLSSTNPNLQNIPIRSELGRRIRSCFVAEPGYRLISADYSQVELRILAHVAGEDVLKEIFARDEDVHAATAAEVLKLAPEEIGPGRAVTGEGGQLRDRLRAERARPFGAAPNPPRGSG